MYGLTTVQIYGAIVYGKKKNFRIQNQRFSSYLNLFLQRIEIIFVMCRFRDQLFTNNYSHIKVKANQEISRNYSFSVNSIEI